MKLFMQSYNLPWKAILYSSDSMLSLWAIKNYPEERYDGYQREDIASRMHHRKIGARVGQTAEYPFVFESLSWAPYIVYYLGNASLLNDPLLSIVGPRKPSVYAQTIVKDLVEKATDYHLVIVSWGAEWIDRLAHETALANNIPTIVVLGCGLRRIIQRHSRLFQTIVEANGLLLSQRKLDQKPTNRTFPARNRIVAGLGECLFVPAAGANSGTVISIDFALQMGKHVYAVPNSIYDAWSEATNSYIAQKKIHAVITPEDVLQHHFRKKHPTNDREMEPELDEDHQRILELINTWQQTVEQLAVAVQQSVGCVLGMLSLLELSGKIHEIQPWIYKKR